APSDLTSKGHVRCGHLLRRHQSPAVGERLTTGSDEGHTSRAQTINQAKQTSGVVEIESGIQAASRWEGWHLDAVASNGSNHTQSSGAPPRRMMPNGRMENPASSHFRLDEGVLMDAFPRNWMRLCRSAAGR